MTAFEALLADPAARRIYAAIIEPYDAAEGQTVALYLSDDDLVTGGADDPAHRYFEPRLISAFNFERHLVSPARLGGRSMPGFGALVATNADGALDGWRALAFDGRRVRLFLGGDGFRFADFGLIFDGAAEALEFDDDTVRLRLRDLQSRFARPIQDSTYGGTGGLDGGPALAGKPRPVVYGRVHHVEPTAVDPATLTYQVHDGPIAAVTAVYDRGVPLAKVAGAPAPGQFAEIVATGCFVLGAAPAGVITADVEGDAADGYVDTVAGIMRRIVTSRGGLDDPGDLAVDSLVALDAANDAIVGIHARDNTEIGEILDRLADSIGAHYGFDRSGRFSVGRLEAPDGVPVAGFSEVEILEIGREPTTLPTWRLRVGYRPFGTALSATDTATGLSVETRADLAEGFRVAEASDPAVREVHPLAGDERRDTRLVDAAAAETEAQRLLELFGVDRDVFRVRVKTQPLMLELGDTIEIRYPRHGLDQGRCFVVIGMVEESAVNEVTLDLWG